MAWRSLSGASQAAVPALMPALCVDSAKRPEESGVPSGSGTQECVRHEASGDLQSQAQPVGFSRQSLSTPFHKYGNIFLRHRSLAVTALKGRIVSRDRKGAVWQEYVTELLK
jgi:hypothetical protein